MSTAVSSWFVLCVAALVLRLKRIHTHAVKSELPFLVAGGLFVASAPTMGVAAPLVLAFTAARFTHSLAYAIQPVRTAAFAVASTCLLVLTTLRASSAASALFA